MTIITTISYMRYPMSSSGANFFCSAAVRAAITSGESAAKNMCIFLVVKPAHLHQHTRAARARKSANMVSANMVSVALITSLRVSSRRASSFSLSHSPSRSSIRRARLRGSMPLPDMALYHNVVVLRSFQQPTFQQF